MPAVSVCVAGAFQQRGSKDGGGGAGETGGQTWNKNNELRIDLFISFLFISKFCRIKFRPMKSESHQPYY